MDTKSTIMARMQNVVISDRTCNVNNLLKVMHSDIYAVLTSFMEIEKHDLEITLALSNSGNYDLVIKGKATRLSDVGKMID